MVRRGGHHQRGPGPGSRGSEHKGRRGARRQARLAVAAAIAVAALLSRPDAAAAQSAIGFQGGVAVDPEQVFGGVYYMTGDIGRGIHLRPGIDGAAGEDLRIGTINLDLIYGYPLGGNGWTLIPAAARPSSSPASPTSPTSATPASASTPSSDSATTAASSWKRASGRAGRSASSSASAGRWSSDSPGSGPGARETTRGAILPDA